jgi:hypothetical protein
MKERIWSINSAGRSGPGYSGLGLMRIVLGVTLAMTMAEFAQIHQLSAEDLRRRLALAPSCQPSITALTTDTTSSTVTVAIECRPEPAAPAPDGAARGGRRPQPRAAPKDS